MDRWLCKLRRVAAAAVWVCLLVPCALTFGADDLDLRFHITWGGGAQRVWQGSIRVPDGNCSQPRSLGIEADAPVSVELNEGVLRFLQPSPVSFDGLDFRVSATPESRLVVELSADQQSDASRRFEVPLADFALESSYTYQSQLDDRQNYLFIRRAPGDTLRVDVENDSLVFAPGERFTCAVQPHLIGLPAETLLRCVIQLSPRGDDRELWREQYDLRTREDGDTDAVAPVHIPLPQEEGVYNVVIALTHRRFATGIVRPKAILQRTVQVIVVEERPPASASAAWREVDVIDLTNREWWQRWMWLPHWKRFPGAERGPLGNGEIQSRDHLGKKLTQIEADKWYAAPIPISRIGEPHLLEIEYPNDLRQTLGMSIIDPDAAGAVTPIGVDSGLDVPERPKPRSAQLKTHRLIFWPRTKTPWLLLTNRGQDAPAVFGRIRVLAGPASLPESPLAASRIQERLLSVYFDKPLFPENFSASESLDEVSRRSLDDWNTFYEGGCRLVQYLQHVGYNAAVVSVLRDGGALYPSKLLDVSPKYDTGIFFSNGQDPVKKDVLELLFRLFDRAGLQLIPALHLGCPLPELESELRRGGPEAEGIELVGVSAGSSRLLRGRVQTQRGLTPHYNPLDDRVQAAIQRLVGELADRYGHHPSFTGLCLQVGPDTFVQLPDEGWPCDDSTVARFQREARVQIPEDPAGHVGARSRFFHGTGRAPWLQWRAQVLADFFRTTQQRLAAARPDVRLFLATADLLASHPVQEVLRPQLLGRADIAQALLRQGIDPAAYRDDGAVHLLRPYRWAPLTSLGSQSANLELSRSPTVDAYFRSAVAGGALNYHEALTLRLAEFDERSPFDAQRTFTLLAAHIPPAGFHNRARFVHSLAALDAQVLLEGGWMVPLGQEDEVRSVFEVFRRLPAAPFQSWAPHSNSALGTDVVVRTLAREDRTYAYVVNDSPWAAVVNIELNVRPSCLPQSLDQRTLPRLTPGQGGSQWTLSMEPYDLIGAVLPAANVTVKDWQVSYERDVEGELNELVKEVRARVNELRRPQPLAVLANPDFEITANSDELAGWSYSKRPGVLVRSETQDPKRGKRCLHLRVESPDTVAWVRSQPFPPPKTGRIFVLAWIRTRDPRQQPPLRLAIDGLVHGEPYYRFAPLGVDVDSQSRRPTGQKSQPLPGTWSESPFLLPIDDLPVSEMTELLIGFDLMGPGEVWIDDVQLFDLYFQENEQDELQKNAAMAGFHLSNGKISECHRYLNGYWPRFLLEHVPAPIRVATVPSPASSPDRKAPEPETPKSVEDSSTWRFLPKIPLRMPFQKKKK